MFTVYKKDSIKYDEYNRDYYGEEVIVYNIRDDKNGYPQFLIHENGEWKYRSAKHYVPELPDSWMHNNK